MNNYLDLLRAKAKLKQDDLQYKVELLVLNNITINPIKEYLEYNCAQQGINCQVTFGDYDNIAQNAVEFDVTNKAIVIFWELANCLNGLEYKIDNFDEEHLHALEQQIQSELKLTFQSLSKASLVIMNRFTALPFCFLQTESGALEALAIRLNNFCDQKAPPFVKWVNTDKCLVKNGINQSIDYKGYLKNKLMYKHAFYWDYAQLIQPYLNALTGKVKKLLALDCDNTLWKGILGEDGIEHIAMDENTYAGQPFAAAQYRALGLSKKGVLLALASKNNAEDVEEVLATNQEVVIKENHLVAQKVNWEAKSDNLSTLANELNIGIDSFVFVDDSDFEVQLMKDQLPAVKTIQVSKNAAQYYVDQQEWANQFVQLNQSQEDAKKLEQYKQNAERSNAEMKYEDVEGFLKALDLKLTIHKNDESLIARMAQMTQKTNQFNLTTLRYSENQIKRFVNSDEYDCFAFGVQDKFGDSGVTGLCIINYNEPAAAQIDSLLMSCRILGRKIEFKFLEEVLAAVFEKNKVVHAAYIRTSKNAQVADFYAKVGFTLKDKSDDGCSYSMKKATFEPSNGYNYITLRYA